MMNKIKEYMKQPYSKGDYYAGIGVVLGIYAILGAAYIVYTKIDELKTRKMIKEVTDKDEEA